MTIRVVIVDDQSLIRAGLRPLLENSPDITVVGEAAGGTEAVRLARAERPDVVLMDIRMPGMDGVEATKLITEEQADVRVIVLTTFELEEYVFESLRAGASGFLGKDVEPERLREAVRVVAAGDALLTPSVTRKLISQFVAQKKAAVALDVDRLAVLTERERDVLSLVGKGASNAEIGKALYMSSATARTHVGRAMQKLDVHDRAQLVVLAYQTGLVAPGEP